MCGFLFFCVRVVFEYFVRFCGVLLCVVRFLCIYFLIFVLVFVFCDCMFCVF